MALLLTKGHADIEAKDSSGCTPLLIAAQYGQVEVVAFLLQKGAQLLALDKSGDTALHWASYKGSIPVCGLLGYYDNALTFAMVDQYGQTPLHLAALRGHTTVVRYILRQLGTTTNTKNGKSSTFSSSSALSDVLFLKDKNGRTPLDLAIHKVITTLYDNSCCPILAFIVSPPIFAVPCLLLLLSNRIVPTFKSS